MSRIRNARQLVKHEEGALNFWRELIAALEADDGTAVMIVNDRYQKAEVRLTEARKSLALREDGVLPRPKTAPET